MFSIFTLVILYPQTVSLGYLWSNHHRVESCPFSRHKSGGRVLSYINLIAIALK